MFVKNYINKVSKNECCKKHFLILILMRANYDLDREGTETKVYTSIPH